VSGHGIRIEGVTKRYSPSARPAVGDVSLDIAPGEFMTFLGPSGSGKTTMLSMIAGFTPMTAGAIFVDDADISGLKPHKRNLGVVFQEYALFPHLSVKRNVSFPLEQRRLSRPEIDRRVAEALELVHLTPFAERSPKQLSGGQQQRVALARAVVYRPRALLMDEPLGALDRRLRDQLRREIARIHRELGITFIFVTHDQEEALTLSDRIAVFNEGRMEQVGTPSELYERPAAMFVAQFLGESNVFEGALDGSATLLDCGISKLRVNPGDAAGLERGATILVRPERLELHDRDAVVPSGHNRVEAVVSEVVYVGSHHRIGLRFPNGTEGCAMRAIDDAAPVMPGGSVVVSWDPGSQALVRPEPAPSDSATDSKGAPGTALATAR
jgi:putative spermidine/putrescine transport system ATP-binding protein